MNLLIHSVQLLLVFFSIIVCTFLSRQKALVLSTLLFVMAILCASFIPTEGTFYYELILDRYLPPFLILTCFLVVSREIHRRAHEQGLLSEELEDQKVKSREILEKFEKIQEIKENLEKRIFKDEDFVLKLQEAISDLAAMDYEEMKTKILEMGVEFCRALSISYYTHKGDSYVLECSFNAPEGLPKEYGQESDLYQALESFGGSVSTRDLLEKQCNEVILACRLITRRGEVLGMVIIHDIDFLDLNTTNTRLFRMLCNWTSLEIEKALRNQNQQFDIIKLHNFRYFIQMIYKEILEIRKQNAVSNIMTLTMKDENHMIPEKRDELVGTLSALIFEHFPNQKAMFYNELKEDRFHIILPDKDWSEADREMNRFLVKLESLSLKPYIDRNRPLELRGSILPLDHNTDDESIESFVTTHSAIE